MNVPYSRNIHLLSSAKSGGPSQWRAYTTSKVFRQIGDTSTFHAQMLPELSPACRRIASLPEREHFSACEHGQKMQVGRQNMFANRIGLHQKFRREDRKRAEFVEFQDMLGDGRSRPTRPAV